MSFEFTLLKGAALGAVLAFGAGAASAQDAVRIGALGGFTGPIASLAPPIVDAGQMAADQVNEQGGILGGRTLELVQGDSGCAEQAAVDAANKAVNLDQVTAVFGPMCSGAYIAAANSTVIPAGVTMVSASATAPTVTTLDDNDLAFRVVPSDAYQGGANARHLLSQGIDNVAVTYVNNDYGQGLAESFRTAFEAGGGTITAFEAHEDAKASYRSELATLAGGGSDTLVVFGYADGSGLTVIRQALENAFFERFVGGDGMKADSLIRELGAGNIANMIISAPAAVPDTESKRLFDEAFAERGGSTDGVFVGQGYDAVFLLALAIEKAGSADRAGISAALREVASAPGEPILPGEWEKAVELIAAGQDIDYKGVTGDHEFDENGDVPGQFAEFVVEGESFVQNDMLQ